MAFTPTGYPHLFDLMQAVAKYPDAETRAIGENFILEERLTDEREQSYADDVGQPADIDDWADKHLNEYIDHKINLRRSMRGRQLETFAQANAPNWLPDLALAQKLIRVENLAAIQKHLIGGFAKPMESSQGRQGGCFFRPLTCASARKTSNEPAWGRSWP